MWVFILIVLFTFGRQTVEGMLEGRSPDLGQGEPPSPKAFVALGIFAGGVLLFTAFGYLSWRMTRFYIGEEHLFLRRGVLMRSQQQLRLDRIQSIDIEQPFLARLLGLAELKFVTADGTGDEAFHLAFLKTSEANELRQSLLIAADDDLPDPHLAEDDDAAGQPAAGAAGSSELIFAMSPARAIGSYLLGGTVVYLVVYVVVIGVLMLLPWGWADSVATGMLAVLVPQLIGIGTNAVSSLPKLMNFRMTRTGRRIVLSQGLASTSAKALRTERIHAITVRQPFLWRMLGWYRLTALTVGGDPEESLLGASLVPAGTWEEVERVAQTVTPELAPYLHGFRVQPEDGFTRIARSMQWLSPLARRRAGHRWEDRVVATRDGWARRTLSVVPLRRVQSLTLGQGPLARACGAAAIKLDLANGGSEGRLVAMSTAEAERLAADLTRALLAEVRANPVEKS
jgi:putative membrane protein